MEEEGGNRIRRKVIKRENGENEEREIVYTKMRN